MNTHIINSEEHIDFLNQHRSDPITGELLKEGDEIVLCASCKSAFLIDTWLYLDKKHCGQYLTLSKIPSSKQLLHFYKEEGEFLFDQINWSGLVVLFPIIAMLLTFIIFIPKYTVLLWLLSFLCTSVLVLLNKVTKTSFYTDRVEVEPFALFKPKTYYYQDMDKVRVFFPRPNKTRMSIVLNPKYESSKNTKRFSVNYTGEKRQYVFEVIHRIQKRTFMTIHRLPVQYRSIFSKLKNVEIKKLKS